MPETEPPTPLKLLLNAGAPMLLNPKCARGFPWEDCILEATVNNKNCKIKKENASKRKQFTNLHYFSWKIITKYETMKIKSDIIPQCDGEDYLYHSDIVYICLAWHVMHAITQTHRNQ